jgi:nicotinamide-nucleotide amidase
MPLQRPAPSLIGSADANVEGAGLRAAARELYHALLERSLKIACAESCTGGLVTAALTDIPGSSEVLWGGVVAYSNECKIKLLGVPRAAIESHGAVSIEVARAMAEGILEASGPLDNFSASGPLGDSSAADLALAITGIAGPGGGSAEKPVGLVCFAWRLRSGESREESCIFAGGRKAVRAAAAERAIKAATSLISGSPSGKG